MTSNGVPSKSLLQALGSFSLFKKPLKGERGKGNSKSSRSGHAEAERLKASRSASAAGAPSSEPPASAAPHSRAHAPAATVGSLPQSRDGSGSSHGPPTAAPSAASINGGGAHSEPVARLVTPDPSLTLRAVVVGGPVDVDVEMGFPADVVVDYWRRKELLRHRKLALSEQSEYVPHRRYMVDWLSEVGEELHLQSVTIHSAIAFLDELMYEVGYNHSQWRLQAVCCLSVAAKYEEAECNMPMISEIADATELRLTTGMITKGELDLVRTLGWDVSRVSAMHYLGYYLYRGVTFPEDQCQGRPLVDKVVRYIKKYVEFFANLCQQDYSFLDHRPSELAAAAVLAARRALCITPLWRDELVVLTRLEAHEIQPCLDQLWTFYEKMFPTHKPLRTESPKCVSDFDPPNV